MELKERADMTKAEKESIIEELYKTNQELTKLRNEYKTFTFHKADTDYNLVKKALDYLSKPYKEEKG